MRFVLLLLLSLLAPVSHASSFLDKLPGLGGSQQATFLPPDQAFVLQVRARDADTLQADFTIAPGYYLYRDKISFTVAEGATKITAVKLPEGELKQDPNFGATVVYHQSFQAEIKLNRSSKEAVHLALNTSYQGCSDKGLCYPSQDKVLQLDLPRASQSTQTLPPTSSDTRTAVAIEMSPQTDNSKIAQLFKSGSFWLITTFFFGAGLLLALTPCVFPMIPILSGIIVGRGHKITRMHAFLLSLTYVLGMAITYAAAGIAAGLTGDLISNALQTPWVLGSFAALFVLLSLSMFGFYELQLPSAWQSKLSDTSNRLHGGHLSGVFVMGALSAVIMGPCVAAPLAGALLYISQTHDAVLGGVALFALALGMGAPLLLIGTSAGALLPRAGAWMDGVKRIFGVMLLALAIWIIQPLLPVAAQMLLWGILLIFSAIYLHALEALAQQANGWHKLRKGLGLLMLLVGIAYLVGALSGARDLLRPLDSVCAVCKADTQTSAPLAFTRINGLADLRQRVAKANGQIVMLDFYADWCVSCKEMERLTFTDPAVQSRLKSAILLQADVTQNSAEDKELLKKFGLYGPPGLLFFDVQGKELADFRVVGYQDAEKFLNSLQRAGL
ncbi:MAG: thiol:disulfide interchange protein [Gallionellales bacterium CG_4_9_14_0_8_um_filter_55_61]|nr:MAG: thiol:disulfide interchange protein [Gallionellales bacterium CG_4_9_14_0_8_um_filter_55_61]